MAEETTEAGSAKDLIRRMNEEVWQAGKLGFVDEVVADGYVEHNTASPEPIRGSAGYKENVQMVHDAFSDIEVTTEDVLAEGDRVAYRYTMTGTHTGPIMGIESTGEEVTFGGMGIARVADGRIVEAWSQVDVAGLMQQLGADPG